MIVVETFFWALLVVKMKEECLEATLGVSLVLTVLGGLCDNKKFAVDRAESHFRYDVLVAVDREVMLEGAEYDDEIEALEQTVRVANAKDDLEESSREAVEELEKILVAKVLVNHGLTSFSLVNKPGPESV